MAMFSSAPWITLVVIGSMRSGLRAGWRQGAVLMIYSKSSPLPSYGGGQGGGRPHRRSSTVNRSEIERRFDRGPPPPALRASVETTGVAICDSPPYDGEAE